MIFTLSEEFIDVAADELRRYSVAIENLINVHRNGWHLFVPGREVGRALVSCLQLSASQMAVLQHHILAKHAELTGQARTVSRLVYCTPDNSSDLGLDERYLVAPLSRFTDMAACLSSELIVENAERDGAFYTLMAESMHGRKAKVPLRFDTIHGGGNTLADELARRTPGNRPTLAIVDSDRCCPGGAVGGTMRRALEIMGSYENPLAMLKCLDVRSLENHIPLIYWQDLCKNDEKASELLAALAETREEELEMA